jgi:hypothetical protein
MCPKDKKGTGNKGTAAETTKAFTSLVIVLVFFWDCCCVYIVRKK